MLRVTKLVTIKSSGNKSLSRRNASDALDPSETWSPTSGDTAAENGFTVPSAALFLQERQLPASCKSMLHVYGVTGGSIETALWENAGKRTRHKTMRFTNARSPSLLANVNDVSKKKKKKQHIFSK